MPLQIYIIPSPIAAFPKLRGLYLCTQTWLGPFFSCAAQYNTSFPLTVPRSAFTINHRCWMFDSVAPDYPQTGMRGARLHRWPLTPGYLATGSGGAECRLMYTDDSQDRGVEGSIVCLPACIAHKPFNNILMSDSRDWVINHVSYSEPAHNSFQLRIVSWLFCQIAFPVLAAVIVLDMWE